MKKLKAILLLIVLPPLMSELLSGWQPASQFFNPIMLIIVFLGYSLPVLIIREISVRRQIGLTGLFIFGMAFGIFNEGLGAKTILSNPHIVNPIYTDYGYIFGINFPFMITAMIWHALSSVVFPILIVHYLCPHVKDQPWIGKKTAIAISVLFSIFIAGVFFSPLPFAVPNAMLYFTIFVVSILVLSIIALIMPKLKELKGKSGIMPLFLGIAFLVVFGYGTTIIALQKMDIAIYFYFAIGVTLLFSLILTRWKSLPGLVLFGIGFYIILGIHGAMDAVSKGFQEGIITAVIFEVFFILSAFRIMKYKRF